MGWGTPDVYYQPERFGLAPVAEIDYSDGSYQFDLRVVWRHEDGAFYTARDSGCSCPSPFEDYTELSDLERLDLKALEAEVTTERDSRNSAVSPDEAAEFVRKVLSAAGRS